MIKIITVIGARPQIIKASAISRAIESDFKGQIEQIIVHTGQHYDNSMSATFFEELSIPQPAYNLQVGSASHAKQQAMMMERFEAVMLTENPSAVLVYGDTNSTLATALVASKMKIPVIHVEAGLRSFNKAMPEEINRILTDHISTLLFCPTNTAITNLQKEGFSVEQTGNATIDSPQVYECGDIMFDNSLHFSTVSDAKSTVLKDLNLALETYVLCTIHRDSNTDVAENLTAIFTGLLNIQQAKGLTIVVPLHPRTRQKMAENLPRELFAEIENNAAFMLIEPVGFLDIIALEKNAKIIVTDSGGLQKEAFFFQKPCVILRDQTEWVEIVANGNALLVGANAQHISTAADQLLSATGLTYPPLFGDGKAAHFMLNTILEKLN